MTIADGRIVATGAGTPPGPARDLGDAFLAPAFVDLQINGYGDCNFADSTSDEMVDTIDVLVERGTGGLLVTVCSAPLDRYPPMLARIAVARSARPAAVLGVHLEGPFLGGAPGAHPTEVVRPVDRDFVAMICRDHSDLVRLVTLAPEADPGFAAVRMLTEAGIVVALGHSTASYAETLAAVDAGAVIATHLFNGMAPMHHREPGLAGAALTDRRLVPTVIADLVHVHPTVLGLTLTARPDAIVVSDAVHSGATHLDDGRLAGSALDLTGAFPGAASIGLPLARVVRHFSGNPARAIGATDRGRVAPGTRADLITVDPVNATVRSCPISG